MQAAMGPILAAASWLSALSPAPVAAAEDVADVATPVPDSRPAFEGALGLQVGNAPQYLGSDLRTTALRPGIYLRWGRFSISTAGNLRNRYDDDVLRGFGAELLRSDDWRVQLGLRIDHGRQASDSPDLAQLDEVEPTLRSRLSTTWRFEPDWQLGAGWSADVLGRGGGSVVDLSIERDIRLSPRSRLSVGAGLSWADQRYMAARFGISPAAAERSGLPAYAPGAGWRDIGFSLHLRTDIDRQWSVWGTASLGRLLGPTVDSPLTRQVTQFAVVSGVVWRF